MKRSIAFIGSLLFVVLMSCFIMINPTQAEDYTLQYEEISDDAEAQVIVRYGDIDNLGFGWPDDFDPFSGSSTPSHAYPWTVDPSDANGTDRIMVISSYIGSPPHGQDGYTGTTSRPDNDPCEINIQFTSPNPPLNSAILQIFVDDFQSPVWYSNFQVTMNDIRVSELEDILNSLNQTGPIGKLITFQIPESIILTMQNNELKILVDDPVTGAGDGFAFDFFRLLINPGELQKTGIITGYVYDAVTNQAISGATISSGGIEYSSTNSEGYYELQNVPAGLAALTVTFSGYESKTSTIDLITDQTATLDFYINESDIINIPPEADDQSINVNINTSIVITLSAEDENNDSLTYNLVNLPSHGTLTGTAPNVTYTPEDYYIGTDSFTFKVNDGEDDSNIATVTISIGPDTEDPQEGCFIGIITN